MRKLTTGNSSLDRELNAIQEQRNESKINKSVEQVKTKKGRKFWEVCAAISVPVLVFTLVLILNHYHLIKEF